jgi:hypothetical protein
MDFDRAQQDIMTWLTQFVEQPHPALGSWPPCPFARKARMDNKFAMRAGTEPYWDLMHVDLGNLDVLALVYDPKDFGAAEFEELVARANQGFLLARDLIALPDHPDSHEIVNGVTMNQGTWALVFVQALAKLNAHAKTLADRGYYRGWPEHYLSVLFEGRQDPRS